MHEIRTIKLKIMHARKMSVKIKTVKNKDGWEKKMHWIRTTNILTIK